VRLPPQGLPILGEELKVCEIKTEKIQELHESPQKFLE